MQPVMGTHAAEACLSSAGSSPELEATVPEVSGVRAAAPPRRRVQSTGCRYSHGPARLEVHRDVLHLLKGHRTGGGRLGRACLDLGLGSGLGAGLKLK